MMNDISFYKEFYFKEIERKNSLDSKVNIPILVLSIIVSSHIFIFSQSLSGIFLLVAIILSAFNFISIIISIKFLVKSYSNYFYSYWYKELAIMDKIRDYEINLQEEGLDNREEIFNEYLINELSNCASENFNLNKTRTENLAKCKQWMFIILLFTVFLMLDYIVFLL